MIFKKHFLLWGFLLCLGGLAACDQAPEPSDLGTDPPVLSEFSYSPKLVNLNGLPASQISGDQVKIPIQLQVKVSDADQKGLKQVSYGIYAPGSSTKALISGDLQASTASLFKATPELSIPKGDVGRYTIKIQALDVDGNVSNQVWGTVEYAATGAAPVLAQVDAPATITRPAANESPVKMVIVATVNDPDGLGNIQRVVMRTAAGTSFLLEDDGQKTGLSGDEVAGDGKYTITIQIENRNQSGVYVFDFQAFDKTGLSSNVIQKTIEVK